jgi:endonuclease YncB( thermonuclease family)
LQGWSAAVLTVFVLSAPGISAATEIVPGPLRADLIRVIDGDTIEVRAHLWLGLELTTRVRLSEIDAPELDGGCPAERDLAKSARDFLAHNLSPTIVLNDVRQDKYGGRVVARVLTVRGEDVGRLLVANRLALNAGSAPAWCQ